MPEDRQAEYLDNLDAAERTAADVWAELDATTQAWIEQRYQARKAELDAQRARWEQSIAEWARRDAEAQALMDSMGW